MNKEEEKSERIVIYPEDVVKLTGKPLRYCRELLGKARKILGRPGGSLLTYRDFCRVFSWDEDIVRAVLKSNYLPPLLMGLFCWIFRDDMDIAGQWVLVWVLVKLWGKDMNPSIKVIKSWLRRI